MHSLKRFRAACAVGVLFGLAVALSGCSHPTTGTNTPTPPAPSSSATTPSTTPTPTIPPTLFSDLKGFKVTGAFNKQVTIDAKWPLKAEQTMSEVLIQGKGTALTSTSYAEISYTGYDARTGTMFDSSQYDGNPLYAPVNGLVPGVTNSLAGKRVGDRVLMAVTGQDGYDSQGGIAQANIQVGDTLIFVMDILDAQLPGPSGTPVTPKAGLPTVTEASGVPTVHIPAGYQAPGDLVVQPLIKGTGPAVKATDAITANYVEVNAADGTVLDTTYGKTTQTGVLDVMIPGWKQGLVGQTVGSRVMLIVPPALAYPNGDTNSTPSIPAGQTLVYVVDILFTQPVNSSGSGS